MVRTTHSSKNTKKVQEWEYTVTVWGGGRYCCLKVTVQTSIQLSMGFSLAQCMFAFRIRMDATDSEFSSLAHSEHRLRPSIEVRITIHNSNKIRTVTCDAGNLSNNNRDTFTISFTIDTQCGSIQGTAQDIAKQCRATFSTSGNAKESISSLLVKGPLPDFLFGSNISCWVRQRQQLEVHQSTEITLCELHSPPSTVQSK